MASRSKSTSRSKLKESASPSVKATATKTAAAKRAAVAKTAEKAKGPKLAAKPRAAPKTAAPAKTAGSARTPAKQAEVAPARAARGEDRAAALRQAAFRCFAEAGFHATTVDDICRAAGVSKGAFYWYFETKEQAFVQILDVWAEEVEGEIVAQFSAAFTEAQPTEALVIALGREGRRGRRMLPVWLDALVQAQRHPELRRALAKFLQRVRRALTRVVSPTFKDFYGEPDIETITGLLLSSFIGSIAQEMAEPDQHTFDEQSRTLLVTVDHFGRLLAAERSR